MASSEGLVPDLAGAVLDGTPIDWAAAESSADDSSRPLLVQLRVLATLAEVHRRLQLHEDSDAVTLDRDDTLTHWGHLRALERIGRGAFGEVYRAWDTRLDREVALKLLDTGPATTGNPSSAVIHEGRLLARVRHPNVVTIYGAEQIGQTIGLWMEFVRGRTLKQIVEGGRVFNEPEAVQIGVDVCHAVAAVHAAGVLHRDIKAQNVMRADDGRVVLMDFGTGRELGDNATCDLTGTPLYVAPEILAGGEATVQSEIYSFGVLLYYLVTGSYPVGGRSLRDVRLAHQRNERIPIQTARARSAVSPLSAKFVRIVDRMIDPRPGSRYQSAEAVDGDLAALRRDTPRRRLASAIGMAAVGLLVAGLGWEVLGLRAGSSRTLGALLAGLAGSEPNVTTSGPPVIAVLPFKNLSAEPESDDFVDGLTDEIIRNLGAVQGLQVRSRTSSFAFKNKPRDLREAAGRLDASLVLEGSVRHSANRFQVEAQLVQAPSGASIWDERFEGDLRDVFAVSDRITREVVGRLGLGTGHVRRAYQVNSEVYGRYLTARALVSRRGLPDQQKAVEYFQQVISMAPKFAPAYAGLADAYAYMSLPTYAGMPVDNAQRLMRTAALKALELDPDLAEAHAAMGIVYARDFDWASSQQHFQQAIALNPSLSQVYTSYSFFTLRPLLKFDEAERLVSVALRRDPLSLDVWREMAELYLTVGRYDEAIDLLERVRAVDPQLPATDVVLARALALRGRIDEALALYDAIEAHNPAGAPAASRVPAGVPHYHAFAYVRAGRRADAERLAAENHEFPYRATIIYAALGDLDRAFEALERTAKREPQRVPLLLTWPEIARLRDDPRVATFRKRFGLP